MLTLDIFERASGDSFSIVKYVLCKICQINGLCFQKKPFRTRTHHLICMRQTDDLAAVAHSGSNKKRKGQQTLLD